MQIMDEDIERRLRNKFEKEMKREIEIVVIKSDKEEECQLCGLTIELINKLSEVSNKIKVKIYEKSSAAAKKYSIERVPSILIDPTNYKIVYTGAPIGEEGWAFIETMVLVSQDDSKLSQEAREKLKELKDERHIEVYVTPTCPYCPLAVLLANKVAIEGKGKVKAECIEVQENMDLAMKYNIRSVPQQIIDGKVSSVGVQPELKFVEDVIRG